MFAGCKMANGFTSRFRETKAETGNGNRMRIVTVTEQTIADAGRIHSESWRASHSGFCSAEFVERHTPAAQVDYLRREMACGKRVYLLVDVSPVGVVSVQGNRIENLYVLPAEQNKGYGTVLLKHAVRCSEGVPTVWVLHHNDGARRFYRRNGFREAGREKRLNEHLREVELVGCLAQGASETCCDARLRE